MENMYDDQMLPENFEQIAKAYAKSLKDKGFVFVRLQEEEFNLLLAEIHVVLSKMQACLKRLKSMNCAVLNEKIEESRHCLENCFGVAQKHNFECIENETNAFLALISLENLLIIKLMLLSVKSGELEMCNSIITNLSGVFATSFSTEGFKLLAKHH